MKSDAYRPTPRTIGRQIAEKVGARPQEGPGGGDKRAGRGSVLRGCVGKDITQGFMNMNTHIHTHSFHISHPQLNARLRFTGVPRFQGDQEWGEPIKGGNGSIHSGSSRSAKTWKPSAPPRAAPPRSDASLKPLAFRGKCNREKSPEFRSSGNSVREQEILGRRGRVDYCRRRRQAPSAEC